ncbi:MAG: methionyl-tRNA formyltransferase [Sandaracinus sp.]|nr:methionyl-tRNA formyltransferase [Myxococcales bacterium]MCB9630830.1 methionyl-tRNA formyltransferase [Sandaracinus sp.]
MFRAAFFGSPAFAVPCLDALREVADVRAVICQPDKPAGRGLTLTPPAVKVRALELGLPVWQPTKVRKGDLAERLRKLELDVGVVVAYGRILPTHVLEAPRLGCVNVHASLLPRWRGASPIQHALVYGDAESGVDLMQMDEGLDTGAVLAERRTPIEPDEDAAELSERLSALGAALVREELPRYVAGDLTPQPQPEDGVTFAKLLSKDDGRLDWSVRARAVHDRVRGLRPWPGTFTLWNGQVLKVLRTHVVEDEGRHGAPGEVLGGDASVLRVACGEGVLGIDEVQEAGRKRLPVAAFLAGRGMPAGTLLGA